MHDRAIWNNFERLYIDYQPRLIAYALRFVGDSVEAQDLVQDCFVRLWDDYAELEEDEAPMLLFTMMRHRCLNFLKHKRIVREYADRQISRIRPDRRGEERLYNLCFSYNEAEYPYLYQELEREIQRITDSLPQRCREVFILSRFQGMKNRKIAERLHISLQAVDIIRKSKCSTDFKRNDFLKKTKRTHWVRFVHLNSLIESCVFLYLWNSPFDTFL